MAISFHCPDCGRDYEVSDAMGGKKARCKGCKTIFEIPPFSIEIGDSGYQVEQESIRESARRAGGPWTLLFEGGDRVGQLIVEECSANQLILTNSALRNLGRAAAGILMIVVGSFLVAVMDQAIFGLRRPVRVPTLIVMLPFILIWYGAIFVCQLVRLGYRMTFDRPYKTLAVRWLFTWERTWEAGDLGGIVVSVGKAHFTHWQGAWSKPKTYYIQDCEGYVVDREGKAVASFERVGKSRPEHYENLVHACLEAGRLLDLPVVIDLRDDPVHKRLRRAVDMIEDLNPKGRGRTMPSFRRPVVTAYTTAIAVAYTLFFAIFGWFLLKHIFGVF